MKKILNKYNLLTVNNTQSKKFLPKNRLPITKSTYKKKLGIKFYKLKLFV